MVKSRKMRKQKRGGGEDDEKALEICANNHYNPGDCNNDLLSGWSEENFVKEYGKPNQPGQPAEALCKQDKINNLKNYRETEIYDSKTFNEMSKCIEYESLSPDEKNEIQRKRFEQDKQEIEDLKKKQQEKAEAEAKMIQKNNTYNKLLNSESAREAAYEELYPVKARAAHMMGLNPSKQSRNKGNIQETIRQGVLGSDEYGKEFIETKKPEKGGKRRSRSRKTKKQRKTKGGKKTGKKSRKSHKKTTKRRRR